MKSTHLKQLLVVCGFGSSDIGKGWLSASIAKTDGRTQVIKIDPFLNQVFPSNIGITLDGAVVSDDLLTYQSMGIRVDSEDNVLNGQVLLSTMEEKDKELQRGDPKKLTFADVAEAMASRLANVVRMDCERLVVEIGGTITDREHAWIPDAFRFLGLMLGVSPQLVVLTYLEKSESGYPVKTQNVRNAIRSARSIYGLPIHSCFVRRRFVPDSVASETIRSELFNIAFEVQFPVNRLILEENYASVAALAEFVAILGLFEFAPKRVFVSACLLGIRCRYNGKGTILDLETLSSLHCAEIVTACPETLGGLGIPRLPSEIQNGDGQSVIDGKAKIKDVEGTDVTQAFLDGAERTCMIIEEAEVSDIFLCEKSPSCGLTRIYDGTFSEVERDGMGILAALLKERGYGNMLHGVVPGKRV
jgi:uncharacterized protein YbbK (DUF523 family)